MIAPGQRFSYGDLAPLLALANSRTSNFFDLSGFTDVSPMNYDPSSNKYGYRQLTGFAIAAQGSGYAPGDLVNSPDGSVNFKAVAVNATGGIIGLLVTGNTGFAPGGTLGSTWPTANDPTPPGALTTVSGIGTGATISFIVVQVGPEQPFALPDYTAGVGIVTELLLRAAGVNYQVGDALTLADISASVNVTGVDGSGHITTFTATGLAGSLTIPQDVAALPATGGHGTGATFTGLFILPQKPQWLTELNRLRNNIWNLPDLAGGYFITDISPATLCVSGPWPVSGPTANFSNTWFYFPNTGSGATVTLVTPFTGSSYGLIQNGMAKASDGFYSGAPVSSLTPYQTTIDGVIYWEHPVNSRARFAFVVGGVDPLFVSGTFNIYAQFIRGGVETYTGPTSSTWAPDSVDPRSLIAVNQSPSGGANAFPGTVSMVIRSNNTSPHASSMSLGVVAINIAVSATLSPGRYELEVVITSPGDDSYNQSAGQITSGTRVVLNRELAASTMGMLGGTVTGTITYSAAVLTNGIHNSLPIYKIRVPGDGSGNGPGLCSVVDPDNSTLTYNPGFWNVPAYVDIISPGNPAQPGKPWPRTITYPYALTYGPEAIRGSGWTITTSVPGFWTALCDAVSSLNVVGEEQMPWNLQRTKYATGGSVQVNPMLLGDQAPNLTVGSLIVAQASGSYDQSLPVERQMEPPVWKANTFFPPNFTIVDSNGNTQKSGVGAESGSTAPAWATNKGAYTWDGGSPGPGVLVWNCIKVFAPKTMASAQHRFLNLPRYPFYWANETIAALMPPTTAGQLTAWGAYDQWMPVNQSGVDSHGHPTYDPGWHQAAPGVTDGGTAYGWWIYSVSLNRMVTVVKSAPAIAGNPLGAGDLGLTGVGAGDTGALGGSAGAASTSGSGEVSVTIGCMRSGAFVAFGTYLTGQTIKVLWPVFTSDALVYQCSERIDMQALAIASTNTVSTGPDVSTPMCAAFITDTEALLTLIS